MHNLLSRLDLLGSLFFCGEGDCSWGDHQSRFFLYDLGLCKCEKAIMAVTDAWSVDDVCDFLDKLQLGHLSPAFKENAIGGKDLAELTDDDLQSELGCKPLQIKKIRRELDSANNASATPAQAPPAQAPPSQAPPAQAPPSQAPPAQAPPAQAPPAQAPPAQAPPGAAPPQYYYAPPQAQPPPAGYPPAGYPPAGYPPAGYPPNPYAAPGGAPATAAPASAPTAGGPTGSKPISPGDLQEYKKLNATIRKLRSEGVEEKLGREQSTLRTVKTSRDATQKELEQSKRKKLELERELTKLEGKKRLMAKMTASKKDRTEHDLDALNVKIPELEEKYTKLCSKYNTQSLIVEDLETRVTELKRAVQSAEAVLDRVFKGPNAAGTEETKRLEYSMLELRPRIAEMKTKEHTYKEANTLVGGAHQCFVQAQQAMHQAYKNSGMDIMGNFFTPGPGFQGPFDAAADIMKRQNVKKSSALVKQAGENLEKARMILPEMPAVNTDVIKKMPGMLMDLLLDNMISDIRARRKITQSMQLLAKSEKECQACKQWTEQKLSSECQVPIAALEMELNTAKAQLESQRNAIMDEGLKTLG
ncbi:hypothetical protein NDN08_006207 [Rhodosorus marinus]|uniref:SAM domain-containing protein n=1 Tax=Rhodosorus marinus TaxID=101924 RepID=A0AAV8UP02_9RHOD|nr:hypothetical protein NDN08_006207 [Rhodosorus marinus]